MGDTYLNKKPTAEDCEYVYAEDSTGAIVRVKKSSIVAAGKDGGYYTPDIDDDGNLTWTASEESMPEAEGANIKGPKGDTGNPGADGKGIASRTCYYLASSSAEGVTTDLMTYAWKTKVQTITSEYKYLWYYEEITYTDESVETTEPCIIGVYGDTGAKGDSGYTPQKGTDYFTNEDKAELVEAVLEALPAEDLAIMKEEIIDLQEEVALLRDEVENIETGTITTDDFPDYVVSEAEEVLDRVLDVQGPRTFNAIFMTDLHNNGGESDVQILHACQGAGYIAKRIKMDAFICLGDHTDSTGVANWDECLKDIQDCNNLKHKYLGDVDELEVSGNHDYKETHSPMVYKLISAFSKNVTWGNMLGGYFYKDYEDYKLRIIGLNTSETSQCGLSDDQYNWFIQSLDLSGKSDAADWQILIISHIPLDWMYSLTRPAYILQAYINGSSWTDGTISCDFADKNQATLIGCVHGHIHNLLVDKLYLGNSSTSTEQIEVYRIAIPEVTESYQNHYSAPFVCETTYQKTSDTAEDTSFIVLCIDLDNKVINAICYGAGIDRKIGYANDATSDSYTNLVPTAKTAVALDTVFNDIGYMNGMYASAVSPFYGEDTDCVCTGIIPCTLTSVFFIKGVTIDTSNSHVRFGLVKASSEDANVATPYFIKAFSESDLYSYITFEELGDQYYKVALNTDYCTEKAKYLDGMIFSALGTGENLIITDNEEID